MKKIIISISVTVTLGLIVYYLFFDYSSVAKMSKEEFETYIKDNHKKLSTSEFTMKRIVKGILQYGDSLIAENKKSEENIKEINKIIETANKLNKSTAEETKQILDLQTSIEKNKLKIKTIKANVKYLKSIFPNQIQRISKEIKEEYERERFMFYFYIIFLISVPFVIVTTLNKKYDGRYEITHKY